MEAVGENDSEGSSVVIARNLKDDAGMYDRRTDLAISSKDAHQNSKGGMTALAGDVVHEGIGHRSLREPNGDTYHSKGLMDAESKKTATSKDNRFANKKEKRAVVDFLQQSLPYGETETTDKRKREKAASE
jgi:hypothetical protein